MRRTAFGLFVAVLGTLPPPASAEPIEVEARPFDALSRLGAQTRGPLTFLGGLELSSRDPRFGGFSGIDRLGDGVLLVSDTGSVLTGRLHHGPSVLAGFENADIRAISPGRRRKGVNDAEDVVVLDPAPDGTPRIAIAFERRLDPVRRFRLARKELVEESIASFPADAGEAYNRGIEAIAVAPAASPAAGRLVIVKEGASGEDAHVSAGWIRGRGRFSIRRSNGFDVTALRFLASGDMLLLERRFSPARGAGMRLRLIEGETLKPGATLDGLVLLEAGMMDHIDNMEGMMIEEDGERPIITLVSDDNQNLFQRTLILQFRLDLASLKA